MGESTVDDFDTWKSNFDDNDAIRREHGQLGYQVFHSVDDPEEVTIIFEWDERENARALFESEEMRERLANAGLHGPPELTFLERVDHTA